MRLARTIWQYAVDLARELSDENAYRRHLQQTGRSHSSAEWQRFIDCRLRRKYSNAKCC